ncbi:MAG: hypothetical protein Q4C01_05900 [Clostridia bacterium]|nr:hypothetical protein [Clostridia bacterium]
MKRVAEILFVLCLLVAVFGCGDSVSDVPPAKETAVLQAATDTPVPATANPTPEPTAVPTPTPNPLCGEWVLQGFSLKLNADGSFEAEYEGAKSAGVYREEGARLIFELLDGGEYAVGYALDGEGLCIEQTEQEPLILSRGEGSE